MLSPDQDAYGLAQWDFLHGRGGYEIAERDDGYVAVSAGPKAYFAPFRDWPTHQRRAMRLVRGRTLDVGCGAGRVALHLQAQGHEVVGIDVSPLAIKVCDARGVRDARLTSITGVGPRLGTFDTIVMMGNNFGLFGNIERAGRLRRRFHRLTPADGRIIAESNDPYATDNPIHLEYHQRNRSRGRMGGQLRIRIRYAKAKTPWFDYLLVSKGELEQIVSGTGWHLQRYLDSAGSVYVAVLTKGAQRGVTAGAGANLASRAS